MLQAAPEHRICRRSRPTPHRPRPAPARAGQLSPSSAPSFRIGWHSRSVFTPSGGRTGRLAGAQFPGAAVYSSPTARTIRARIVPRQLQRPWSEMISMHPHLISQLIADRQADLMAAARQQRLARQARAARRARPAQRGRAAPVLAALSRLAWRRSSPRTIQTPAAGPGRAAPTPCELDLLKTRRAGTDQPRHRPPARAQRPHRAPAPGQHPSQAQPVLPRRGLRRAHRGSSENSERPRYKRRPPRLPTAQ
jgi:hypothetical protein